VLEGTFRGHLAQPPGSEQGHLQLHQVPQSHIQSDLECFQGWGLHYLAGQFVPVNKSTAYIKFSTGEHYRGRSTIHN